MKPEQIYKRWRKDVNKWETKINLFWFINYYIYTVRQEGTLITQYRLFKHRDPDYIKEPKPIETKTHIGSKEFKTKYLSNKWMIPLNKYLDLSQND